MKKYIKADTTSEKTSKLNEKIVDALEYCGWYVGSVEKQGNDTYVEIENYSSLGESLIETIWYDGTDKGFIDSAIEVLQWFDPDEHAEELISMRGQNGVPDNVRAIIDDADDIKELYDDTCMELGKIQL